MRSDAGMRSPAFDLYVARASEGKNSVWRIVLAVLLIATVWFGGTILVLFGAAIPLAFYYAIGGLAVEDDSLGYFDRLFETPVGVLVLLLSIAAIWPGVWLAIRLIHRRRLFTLFGL